MGMRAYQVTRILKGQEAMESLGGHQVSVMVYEAKDDLEARAIGAGMLGVSPSDVTVQEYETTGLSASEALRQAEAIDARADSVAQMTEWMRCGR